MGWLRRHWRERTVPHLPLSSLPSKGLPTPSTEETNDPNLGEATRIASKNLLADFKKRWNWSGHDKFSAEVIRGERNRQVGILPALFVACFLDPRTHPQLRKLSRKDQRGIKDEVLSKMVKAATVDEVEVDETPGAAPVASAANQPADPMMDFLESDAGGTANNGATITPEQKCEDELTMFVNHLEDNPLPLVSAFLDEGNKRWGDPLAWWKTNEIRFPTLAKLARIHLAIPATSAPSKHVFSKAGQFIDQLRTKLSPETASMTIFMKSNLASHEAAMEE